MGQVTTSVIIPTTMQGFVHMAKLMPTLSGECQDSNAEIIVVDNASRDGTSNYLSNFNCTIIVNKANEGFAKANNRASQIARGDYLLFLNNDTVITKGFLQTMQRTFDVDDKIGIVGCLIMELGSSVKKVQHIGVCFTPDYVAYELGSEKPDIAPQIPFSDVRVRAIRDVPAVTAACLMIKKSVFEEAGGFNDNFINGWEDVDLCLRVRELGYKIYYNGNAVIAHQRFGSKNAGRFNHEQQNRALYDSIWVSTGRAEKVLGGVRES